MTTGSSTLYALNWVSELMPPLVGLIETTAFTREAEAALSDEELNDLKEFLTRTPEWGVVIPGTGGVRKLRWSASGRGKRGGGRVIYYFHNHKAPIVLFRFFAKAAKSDLTANEKGALMKVVEGIKAELKRRN